MLYRAIRNLHLYAGLALLLLVVMYFISGYLQIHRPWFGEGHPNVTTRTQTLAPRLMRTDPDALAQFLRRELDLPGRPARPRQIADGSWKFHYHRPGLGQKVVLSADRCTVTVTTTQADWQETLIALHRLHGYGGGWFYNLWAAFLDLTSAAMILFGLTGIYLWWRLTRRRWPGLLALAATHGLAVATLLYVAWR